MEQPQNANVQNLLELASVSLNDAKILAENEIWSSSIYKLYQGCYYAMSVLLFIHSIDAKSHEEVKFKFINKFIESGLFNTDFGSLVSNLFDCKFDNENSECRLFDREITLPLIMKSDEFITIVKTFVFKYKIVLD